MISVIIVNYKVEEQVLRCIKSLNKNNFEIIIVDNSEKDLLSRSLKKQFPKVKYIKNKENIGFGAANNTGALHAKGEYLFFLNPDTEIISGNISNLLKHFKNDKAGMIAPLLVDESNKPYELQGTRELTPKTGIFSLSFLSKVFPKNKIYKEYYLLGWNQKKIKDVDVVPGTAFIIRKSLFEKVGGFDEKFFLFFEEFDLANRIKKLGFKNYIDPEVKVFHKWGESTKQNSKTNSYFEKSRFYYFKKNYGLVNALITESFLRFNSTAIILITLLGIGLFLRTFRLPMTMSFISDIGLFYLPARDLAVHGIIPLVGPETSHPWIHHGAHWIYVLALILKFSNFDPVIPGYFIALLGTFTILVFYFVVRNIFGKDVALLSSILYTFSPMLIINSRFPYHTSPIPFFVILLFFCTYKLTKGKAWIFPVITFLLGVLYNHEITTFVYFISVGIVLLFGFIKKEIWFKKILKVKIFFASLITFIIPMLPFIIYDTTHGYNQTLRFLVWVVYRIVKFPLSLIDPRFKSPTSGPSTLSQFFSYYERLIFNLNDFIALFILVLTFVFVLVTLYKGISFSYRNIKKVRLRITPGYALLFLFLGVSLMGFTTHRVPIEADTLLISPFIIILTASVFYAIFRNKLYPAMLIIIIISILNIYSLLSTDFFTVTNGGKITTYKDKLLASKEIVKIADGRKYNLIGRGTLDNYKSFTMPYEYLTWWKGNGPVKENTNLKIVVWEKGNTIVVYEDKHK